MYSRKYVLYQILEWGRGVPIKARQVDVKYFDIPPEGIVPYKYNLDNTIWWPAEMDPEEPGPTYINPDL